MHILKVLGECGNTQNYGTFLDRENRGTQSQDFSSWGKALQSVLKTLDTPLQLSIETTIER